MVVYNSKDFASMVNYLYEEWTTISQVMKDAGILMPVDEMSLLFLREPELDKFMRWCSTQERIKHFNTVQRDRMIEYASESYFDVRFEFLRVDEMPWRIEAMTVLEGIAPLHEQHLKQVDGEAVCIHASFKCKDIKHYLETSNKLIEKCGLEPLKEYQNSYGRFCYFAPEGQEEVVPYYIKPRVNLRDV